MDPTKKELYVTKRSSGVDISDPEIADAWEKIKNDGSLENWMLLSYADGTTLRVCGSGTGGIDELLLALNDDEAFFGCLRVKIQTSIKFYSLSFVGDNLSGMKRGKASLHRSGVLNAFECHGGVVLEGMGGAGRDEVIRQIALQTKLPVDCIDI